MLADLRSIEEARIAAIAGFGIDLHHQSTAANYANDANGHKEVLDVPVRVVGVIRGEQLPSAILLRQPVPLKLGQVRQRFEITHAVQVDLAHQVIELVLNDASKE